jgi:hypothetical protein
MSLSEKAAGFATRGWLHLSLAPHSVWKIKQVRSEMLLQHKLVKEHVSIDVGFIAYRLECWFVTHHEILVIFFRILLYVHAD